MRQVSLPDGTRLWASNALEAAVLFREIVTERTYERHGVHVEPGDTVFDVGANIGLFAIHLARTVPRVRVHAFEPVPGVFEMLSRNVASQAPGVRLYNVGLADREGEAVFEVDPGLTMTASMHPGVLEDAADRTASGSRWLAAAVADLHRAKPSVSTRVLQGALGFPLGRLGVTAAFVPVWAALALKRRLSLQRPSCRLRTLSWAIAEAGVDRVDLVKVDVEGAEEAVLDGIDERTWPLIRQLVIEVHDVAGRLERLRRLLEARGYRTAQAREDWELHELLGISTLYAARP